MAITNGYATLAQAKTLYGLSASGHDADWERAIESASRKIDKYCGRGRFFYDSGSATARTFRVRDPYMVDVPDFHTTTGLVVKTDTTDDGTFDTTWDSSDFQVEPLDPDEGWPWTRIVAVDDRIFPTYGRRARVQVTAQWGWAAVPTDVEQVCLELAGEIYKRKDAPFGVASFNDFGEVRVSSSDLRHLVKLISYQRVPRHYD